MLIKNLMKTHFELAWLTRKMSPIRRDSFIPLSLTKKAAVACILPQLTSACDLGGKSVCLAPITVTVLAATGNKNH